jgi:thiol-disulfide isomerase/thioredoxin
MKKLFLLLPIAWMLQSPLSAEMRAWANAEGKVIEGELVRIQGDQVTMKLRNGKTVTFAKDKLSAADQKYLETAEVAAAKPVEAPKVATTEPAETGAAKTDLANRKAKWLNKKSKAEQESKETGLPTLVLFTGTTWCPYCIKLEKQVFAEKAFKEMANKKLVLLMLDFPSGGGGTKEMREMAEAYGVKGYPAYFLVDSAGKQLARGGYNNDISPASFEAWVDQNSAAKP